MPALGGMLANQNLELVPGFLFAQALARIGFWSLVSTGGRFPCAAVVWNKAAKASHSQPETESSKEDSR
jgi:hypothetical protein